MFELTKNKNRNFFFEVTLLKSEAWSLTFPLITTASLIFSYALYPLINPLLRHKYFLTNTQGIFLYFSLCSITRRHYSIFSPAALNRVITERLFAFFMYTEFIVLRHAAHNLWYNYESRFGHSFIGYIFNIYQGKLKSKI